MIRRLPLVPLGGLAWGRPDHRRPFPIDRRAR